MYTPVASNALCHTRQKNWANPDQKMTFSCTVDSFIDGVFDDNTHNCELFVNAIGSDFDDVSDSGMSHRISSIS